ncbi:MAG: hypothetical protein Q9217_001671 [Psora testacea]
MNFPYTYFSCPCVDVSIPVNGSEESDDYEDEEQERAFDPRSPRANFSLYPLEHLLYCEDCQQIRCPRCTLEEILPLSVTSINSDPSAGTLQGPFILSCGYCNWSTLNIGWKFEKPTGIHSQIAKFSIGEQTKQTSSTRTSESEPEAKNMPGHGPDATFTSLKTFYRSQLSSTNPTDPLMTPSGGYNYSSPSSLARIMSLYTGRGNYGKKDPSRSNQMRESADASEGLRLLDPASDDEAIAKMRKLGWTSTTSIGQRAEQRHPPRFVDDLRPIQALLRTKRSKRCRSCRHILVKPEPKVQSTRFKIKLVALNYIPTISLKPLQPSPSTQIPFVDLKALPPLRASQYLLTLQNPLFDRVKITLATPALTSGRFKHKITILCPEFDIGPNVDQWDEALSTNKAQRLSKHLSLTKTEYAGGDGGKVAEAGKVWEKGRNWTTVVVEVVVAKIDQDERALEEDEDVLEIPVFVRMEWEAEVNADDGGLGKGDERKEKRELAYWVVVGVGRVGRLDGQHKLGRSHHDT